MQGLTSIIVILFWLTMAFAPIITHIVYCFQSEKYILLLAGTLIFPVGWLHGIGLWFGFW